MEENAIVGEDPDGDTKRDCLYPNSNKFWRSGTWSSRSPPPTPDPVNYNKVQTSGSFQGPCVPLTPRSQICKSRSSLPPLQPLSITKRCLEEWPKAGSDDIGEWPFSTTPRGKRDAGKPLNGPDIKLDLSSMQRHPEPTELQLRRDKFAFFDKECSRVAEHIYLGSDAVAKNREVLRKNGITHVLNCVGFVCPEYFKTDLVYKTLWLQDSPCEDITSILYDVFDYFEEVREQDGRVLVHCCQGVSRSTSLVIAYLMWRKGQSFEDAFQYVKAARGITNPNIGFASQLSQCQKRVHAAPMSPNSLLRMYRMAPHSSYAPLHLVPKSINPPLPNALDSRGAFIVHVPSAIYVWIGISCHPVMKRMAEGAASQVVRYERAQGPIVVIKEGHETDGFRDAFLKASHLLDDHDKSGKSTEEVTLDGFCSAKGQVDIAHMAGVGNKRVDSYNIDFELFGRAISGGVVPPFPLSGAEGETHLPARENGWDILRRKFVSGGVKDLVTASKGTNDIAASDLDVPKHKVDAKEVSVPQSPDIAKSLFSPSLSPAWHFTDFIVSSKSTTPSPSSISFTSSPNSSAWSPFSPSPSPSPVSSLWESFAGSNTPSELSAKPVSFPSKGPFFSLAQRRKNISPSLELQVPRGVQPWTSEIHQEKVDKEGILDFEFQAFNELRHGLNGENSEKQSENKFTQKKELWLSDRGQDKFHNSMFQTSSPSTDMYNASSEDESSSFTRWKRNNAQNWMHPLLYKWPKMEKFEIFDTDDLDHGAVFILLAPSEACQDLTSAMVVYVWVGSDSQTTEANWEQIGRDFLQQIDLPRDIPIRVVRDREEPEEFWYHFNNG